ncbi:MAG: glycosyltransferase [Gemmatimonadaceae bacterium]
MKVFLAGTSFLPAYGGPAYSVSRLAVALARCGVQVGLWAADQSGPVTPLLQDDSGFQHLSGSVDQALETFGAADVIHDNGIWMPHNHQLAKEATRSGVARLVSTRGMLEPWAIGHKRLKKRLAWMMYQQRDLEGADGLHATADSESASIARLALGVPIHVIPNGVDMPEISGFSRNVRGGTESSVRTALFLGRIYPVKGLPMLVEAWARVRPVGWRLLIAGPDEGDHKTVVERAVSAAGLGEVVSFVGPVHGEVKRAALLNADVFVLPTYSESFGMAIAEALAHGLPVLTTTGAPWAQLPIRGCGWQVDPTVEGVEDGLRRATSMTACDLAAMGERGREFVRVEFGWDQAARRMAALYSELQTRN